MRKSLLLIMVLSCSVHVGVVFAQGKTDDGTKASRTAVVVNGHRIPSRVVAGQVVVTPEDFAKAIGASVSYSASGITISTMSASGTMEDSLGQDEKAKNAVLAMKKLQAMVESGVSRQDYTRALAEANFPLKLLVESDVAEKSPAFVHALQDSMRLYKGAGDWWDLKISSSEDKNYCSVADGRLAASAEGLTDSFDFEIHSDADLCADYPGLVKTGKSSSPFHYVQLSDVFQENWRLAGVELNKAAAFLK